MTINLAIIRRFIGVRVGGCGLSRIKAICFSMTPTTSPIFVLSPLICQI
jgi:hypothetical protein